MQRIILIVSLFVFLITPVRAVENQFISLCYHDIIEGLSDKLDADQMAVGTDNLIAHFSWLKTHGYNVISLQDILDAREGGKSLPKKAVLITFDDGYVSVYKYLYPILKMYNYSAVVGLVGKWLEPKSGASIKYGSHEKDRSFFLTWKQIREMQASGHIEVASHSFDSHHGILSNPQGNVQAAVTTHKYNKKTQLYETDQEYYSRIKNDLQTNSNLIEKHTGVRPRAMVWPYGAFSGTALEISREVGMPITLTLKAGRNNLLDLSEIRRILVIGNPTLTNFAENMEYDETGLKKVRGIRINLDDIYDEDPVKFGKNFNSLLDRVKEMRVNTIYLSPFSDIDKDGVAEAAYFPSKNLPMRADILNRVSWQLRTRAIGEDATDRSLYFVTPFSAFKNEKGQLGGRAIINLFGEMAKQAYTEGILFSDVRGKRSDGFAKKLIEKVKYFRPAMYKFGLMVSSQTVIDSAADSEYWTKLKKTYNTFVINIDHSSKESGISVEPLLKALHKRIDLKDVVFEQNTIDNETNKKISDDILLAEIDYLMEHRAVNISHYPDDFAANHPSLNMLKSKVSLNNFPLM